MLLGRTGQYDWLGSLPVCTVLLSLLAVGEGRDSAGQRTEISRQSAWCCLTIPIMVRRYDPVFARVPRNEASYDTTVVCASCRMVPILAG